MLGKSLEPSRAKARGVWHGLNARTSMTGRFVKQAWSYPMSRVGWKTAVACLTPAFSIASMVEASPIGHIQLTINNVASEANRLVVPVHGSHGACRYGSYGKS
jgi:hypothetical protein